MRHIREILTSAAPHGPRDAELDHVDDGSDDDSRERRLGDVDEVGRQELERADHQQTYRQKQNGQTLTGQGSRVRCRTGDWA